MANFTTSKLSIIFKLFIVLFVWIFTVIGALIQSALKNIIWLFQRKGGDKSEDYSS